jgi:ribose 5-phosphate isomerase B
MKIAVASDHAGYELKNKVVRLLEKKGYEVNDFGTHSPESTDYPDYAHPLGESVEKKESALGIVMCGSGNGINMAVNKHQGIRSALCWEEELAEMARKHNDANVLSLPARYIDQDKALKLVEIFLDTEFEGGRHQRRVDKIPC